MGYNLYEMEHEMESLLEQLVNENTGEVNEDILAKVEELEGDIDERVHKCGLYIKNQTALVDALTNEINALKKRRDVAMNRISRTCDYVNVSLKGQKKEFGDVAFSFRTSKSVDIINEDLVPDELCRFETKRTPVKTDIKEKLTSGEKVPGCVLVEKLNLQVK